jgi:hypothetical protein
MDGLEPGRTPKAPKKGSDRASGRGVNGRLLLSGHEFHPFLRVRQHDIGSRGARHTCLVESPVLG